MGKITLIITILLASWLGVTALDHLPAGTHSFRYTMPSGAFSDTLEVFYHIPEIPDRSRMPVVFGFHGNDRDCSYWVETWKEYADKKGFMFFIPWFTHEKFPTRRYQELGVKDADGNILPAKFRTSALVDSIICDVLRRAGSHEDKVTVYGHSAGAQFVHRFMMLHDSPFVGKAIIGNPGWFTFPSVDENYSYGIKDLEAKETIPLREMLRKDIILQLAEGDTIRESYLRKTPEADRQGLNRLERGNRFFETLDSIAKAKGYEFNWKRVYVAGVGHDAVAMSRHAAQKLLSDSISTITGDQQKNIP